MLREMQASARAQQRLLRITGFTLVIPIVAIAALLAYFLTKPAEQVAQQGATIAQNLVVGGVDVSKQVTDSIASLRSTLGGVTDAASAEAALPKLRDITAQIDQVDDLIGRMTPEQRKLLAGIVVKSLRYRHSTSYSTRCWQFRASARC